MPIHIVEQGEHLSSIAEKFGFRGFRTIWNDAKNKALRDMRKNPHVLMPGDSVFIPDKEAKTEDRAAGATHRSQVKHDKLELRVLIQGVDGEPIEETTVSVLIDGVASREKLQEGMLQKDIARNAREGKIELSDDQIPVAIGHLWRQLIGAMAWSVEYDNLSLSLKGASPGAKDLYQRRFVVLMLEDTGRIWSIRSIWPEAVPDFKPEPSPEIAEVQMRPEKDLYVGLPEANPSLSFLDALSIVLNQGVGSPFQAKEIDACYVMESERDGPPRPIWAITLRGIPPLPVSDPSIPVWQRNRMRNVIDVQTGGLLFATNSPQPQ